MQESLTPEYGSELITNILKEFLDRGRVTNKGSRYLKALRRNRVESSLDIIRNLLYKVRGVLILDIAYLVLNLLNRDFTTEISSAG